MKWTFFYCCTLLIILFARPAHGQIGLSIKHAFDMNDYLYRVEENLGPYHGGILTLDYRIKLRNYGVEFGPEVYAKYVRGAGLSLTDDNGLTQDVDKVHRSFGIGIPVTLYIFHFDQCDECPTFKKKNSLKNRFFIQPIIGFEVRNIKHDGFGTIEPFSDNDQLVFGGIGLGVDFWPSKLIKVSPMIQYRYHYGFKEHPIELPNEQLKSHYTPSTLEIGVRVAWGR